ncbi:hypothetical protein H6F68_26385 [Trichocoleus sp. FACHB-262]|nr:hypothetical protein [Trichocoleus sp. FACHB-262]
MASGSGGQDTCKDYCGLPRLRTRSRQFFAPISSTYAFGQSIWVNQTDVGPDTPNKVGNYV